MYGYIGALAVAVFTLIMNLCRVFSDLGDYVFTDQKTYVCFGISIVLIIIGVITDKREW